MARGQAWAKLRVEGIRTSKERVRRLMREHDLQAPSRVTTITTEAPDVMWGTAGHGARRRGGLRLRGCRSLHDRVHRAPCGRAPRPADPQGVRERTGEGRGPAESPHEANYLADDFPGGRLLRHRELSELRAGTRRQRRSGALHPHAEGESVMGAEFRDDRRAPPSVAHIQANVQRPVDAYLSQPRAGATRPRRAGRGTVLPSSHVQEPWGDTGRSVSPPRRLCMRT